MSLFEQFQKECVSATLNNIKLVQQKLADAKNPFNFKLSGALVDAAKQGMGPLADFAGDYLEENADKIAFALVEATGADNAIREALDTVYKYISLLFLAQNTMVLVLMKGVGRNIIAQLDSKDIRLNELESLFTSLHNALLSLSRGDPAYSAYLANLRAALAKLLSANTKLKIVRNSLATRTLYLSKVYKSAQDDVAAAQHNIRPSTGDNPFTAPFLGASSASDVASASVLSAKALLATTGVPTSQEQIDNILAIPKISKQIIIAMKDYGVINASINGMLKAYIAGIEALTTALQDVVKGYALTHLDSLIKSVTDLSSDMKESLKGTPNPVKVTGLAFKWTAQVSFIIAQMKILPGDALRRLSLEAGDIAAFQKSIDDLKALNNIVQGQAILVATEAQEDIGALEQQVLTALLRANGAVASGKIDNATLSLVRTIIARIKITKQRNERIRSILLAFINFKLFGEDEIQDMLESINALMRSAGLDRAIELLKTGDYTKFFKLNAKTATYVGAALEAIAFLKDCFDSEEKKQEITKTQRKLERDLDLLSIKLSFDFDVAIFKNLLICKTNINLALKFNLEEFLCGLAEDAGIGKIFGALDDVLSF